MLLGQFTYGTVTARGPYSAAAGWKVVQVLPDHGLSAAQVQAAVVSLGSFQARSIPALALARDLDRLPIRLRTEDLDGGLVALVCQRSCGLSHDRRDSSFAHGLIVNVDDGFGLGAIRPAELWQSAGWKHPLGAEEVAACRLAEADAFSVELVRDLTTGKVAEKFIPSVIPENSVLWERNADLARLVLAVFENAASRSPGVRHLAILDEDGTAAATWTAFLARHVFPGSAWKQIAFSTYEEGVAANPAGVAGLMIIGVPGNQWESLERVLGESWLLVDPDSPPVSTIQATPGWILSGDRRLDRGPWTLLMEQLNDLDTLVEEGLTGLVDLLALECRGSADRSPLWAAPAALLLNDFASGILREAAKSAARLVFEEWPRTLSLRADLQARLVAWMKADGLKPISIFEKTLRALDNMGSTPAGIADSALEGYFSSLWESMPDGSPPGWVAERDFLPWLPATVRPSAQTSDNLMRRVTVYARQAPPAPEPGPSPAIDEPATIAGTSNSVNPASDRDRDLGNRIRLLGSIAVMADRWEWPDQPHLRELVFEPLVDAVLESIRFDEPVTSFDWGSSATSSSTGGEAGWPTLPQSTLREVARRLESWLNLDQGAAIGRNAAAWLDQALGPVELDESLHAFRNWSSLDLARAIQLQTTEEPLEDDIRVLAVRLAAIAARRLDAPWSAGEWFEQTIRNFGRMLNLDELAWFMNMLIAKEIPVPVPELGDYALRGVPLGAPGHTFAKWILRPTICHSKSARGYGSWTIRMFPVLQLHSACRPELPTRMEPEQDLEWTAEMLSLQGEMIARPGVLGETARLRAVADILLVDLNYIVEKEPLPAGHFDSNVVADWFDRRGHEAFALIIAQLSDDRARRMKLAGSLLIRAFIHDAAHVQAYYRSLRSKFYDPAGVWLISRPDAGNSMWTVEDLIRDLLQGADKGERQRWTNDSHDEAMATIKRLASDGSGASVWSGSSLAGVNLERELVEYVLADIDRSASRLAFGAMGRLLSRPGRRGGQHRLPVDPGSRPSPPSASMD